MCSEDSLHKKFTLYYTDKISFHLQKCNRYVFSFKSNCRLMWYKTATVTSLGSWIGIVKRIKKKIELNDKCEKIRRRKEGTCNKMHSSNR